MRDYVVSKTESQKLQQLQRSFLTELLAAKRDGADEVIADLEGGLADAWMQLEIEHIGREAHQLANVRVLAALNVRAAELLI